MKERAFPRQSLKESAFSLANAAGEVSGRPPREAMLGLVQRVFFQSTRQPPRMVVFTGVDHGDGCSQIAASAAESLASSSPKSSVCLVEANFRSPSLSTMLEPT